MKRENQTITQAELELQRDYMQKTMRLLAEKYNHPPLAYLHSFGCPFVRV